ncbi:hypothetical protein YPPY88_2523, partial [Yersinia pestis PY-88]
MLIIKR